MLRGIMPQLNDDDWKGECMRLIVGLGNPGEEYDHTRHNAGFDTVSLLAEELRVNYWKTECGALTAKTTYRGEDVLLAKPQSFMNVSGGPVKQLCAKYEVDPKTDLIVIHDELDIDPGTIRVKFGGGLAGHNGLKSIDAKLQTRDWLRIRIGIGRPPGRMPVTDWVLSKPKKEAWDDFVQGTQLGCEAVLYYMDNGLDKAQQKYNSSAK
ncbi:Peptidyl-tRNA hydrolase [Slackia heliotrinireducens]|nr:Peptidyl-tRNA hydrolase [Slackia heliotrinireducens]